MTKYVAYQESGADWADPTYVDFWTGIPLLVISVAGLILYASGLVEELRRRGITRRPYASPPGQPQAPGSPPENASGSVNNMDHILLPRVTAMLKDIRERDRARKETLDDVRRIRNAGDERSVRK